MDRLYFTGRLIGKIDLGNFDDEYIRLIEEYYDGTTNGIQQEIRKKLLKSRLFLPRIIPREGGEFRFWCEGYEFVLKELFRFGQNLVNIEDKPIEKPYFLMDFLSKYRICQIRIKRGNPDKKKKMCKNEMLL